MEYPVIVEQRNGVYRALIPTLPNVSAEGASYEEAVRGAQHAAEAYLSQVVVTSVEVETIQQGPFNPRSPQTWINSAGRFADDEEAMQTHIEEIYAERKRQQEQVDREAETS
jgi:predicted RNase H-like HicB family nuclease